MIKIAHVIYAKRLWSFKLKIIVHLDKAAAVITAQLEQFVRRPLVALGPRLLVRGRLGVQGGLVEGAAVVEADAAHGEGGPAEPEDAHVVEVEGALAVELPGHVGGRASQGGGRQEVSEAQAPQARHGGGGGGRDR